MISFRKLQFHRRRLTPWKELQCYPLTKIFPTCPFGVTSVYEFLPLEKLREREKLKNPINLFWFCIFLGTSETAPRTQKILERERRGRRKLRVRELKHI